MKKLTIAAMVASSCFAYSGQVAAKNGFDICESNQNPLVHSCANAGMFDVPYDTISKIDESWKIQKLLDGIYDRYKLFGFAAYYQELEEEADRNHQRQAEQYTDNVNSDLTDNYAYALVTNDRIQLSINQDTKWYFWLDIIEGTDWDNNGKIDILEAHNLYGNHLHW